MKYFDKIGFKVYDNETFIKAMSIINPKIVIMSNYTKSSESVDFLCECGEIHKKSPNRLLRGARCKKFIGSTKIKKEKEFIQKLHEINDEIEMIDEYVDANTKIKFKCVCGQFFYKTPSQMIRSNPLCPKCANNRLSATEIIQKIKEISPGIIIDLKDSDEFVKKRLKVNCKCKCGNEWSTAIEYLLSGQGCAICNRKKHSHDEYIQMVYNVNENIKILSEYTTLEDNITYKCKCGNIHTKNARQILRNPSCPKCANNIKKTTEQFIKEMENINSKIFIIGEYINAETPIEYICDCGKYHKASPSVLLQGHRCGHCNMSKPEQEFANCLETNEIKYEYDYKIKECLHKNMLKFDFWLPKYATLVEIDGEHHYKPVNFRGISDERAKERHEYCVEMDSIKNEFCNSHNIVLIRIPYWNFSKEYYNKIIQLIKWRQESKTSNK